jgi:hypothetical protein
VAHVVATAGRSGVERHLEALLPAFDRAEVEPRLFVPGPGPLVDALAARGVRAEPGAPTHKLAWGEARALARRLRGACDVLHAHGPRAAFWAAHVARAARVPLVCTVHELRWRSLPPGPRRFAWVALERWALGRAERLIVLSRDSEQGVRERFPALADRLVLIPGSSPLLLDPAALPRTDATAPASPVRVLSIGRLEWVKGHDRLLDAFALAVGSGANLELMLGGDGPLAGELERRAGSLGIAGRVRWLGRTFDVREALRGAHVYATATRAETFGIAVLEAMACGLPIVAPAVGGLTDLVQDRSSGRLAPDGADTAVVQGLARALVELAAGPGERAALGRAAAEQARSRFSPAAMARATLAVYREVPAAG